jgi:hypothetical protein
MATTYLLIVTEDGYRKRIHTDEIPRTRRAVKGVKISTVPVAAAVWIDGRRRRRRDRDDAR